MAAGKGVYISENYLDASKAVDEIFNGKFGKAENLLIEEFLNGEEMVFLLFLMAHVLKFLEQHKITKEFLKEIKVKILVAWEHIHHQD